MSEAIFERNLELWSRHCPKEAVQLQYVECSPSRPEDDGEEALEWKETIDLASVTALFVYGVGQGGYYRALKEWLKADSERHAVFLEDDAEALIRLFYSEKTTELLCDPQVSLYYFHSVSDADQIFDRVFWDFPMTQWGFEANVRYKESKKIEFIALREQLSYDAAIKNSLLKEYLDYGIVFFRNFYANMRKINKAYLGNALFGKFKEIPAIICGAGPSLQKNVAWLEKAKGKALIFAGSSALNALAAAKIDPDIAAGIDPNEMQEKRLKKLSSLNFPFFYRNRLHPGALDLVNGEKLYITGSGGYPISGFFESRLGIEGEWVEEGRNVVNFCLEIACEMGCNPIIFAGMDLAFTGDHAYSAGVIGDPSKLNVAEHETIIIKKDIFGKDVKTLWKWIAEAKWIGDFSGNHPEKTVINATEGGIGFPGIENVTLQSAVNGLPQPKTSIEKQLKEEIEKASLSHISNERIEGVFQELEEGLVRCKQYLETMDKENEKLLKSVRDGKLSDHSQTGEGILAETELLEEPVFHDVLQIFNQVAAKLMQREIRELSDPKNPLSEAEKEIGKLILNKQKYLFLARVLQVNLELLRAGR